MPPDAATETAQTTATRERPVRRTFAPPSRQGLLVCAASLMPAYLFGMLGLLSVMGLVEMVMTGPDGDLGGPVAGWLHLGHQVLTTAFSLLICWLFLIRRPSAQPRGAGGWISDAAAVGGTVVVLGISQAPRTVENLLAIAAAEVLMTIGLVIMVFGLLSLGRSFGIMPRARGLVQSGLYRWVRHPIYLGEFLVFAGILMLALSPLMIAIYTLFVGLQVYRLVVEERTLSTAYPDYAVYCTRTARLLPGVY
jgi:protein-S-isoprenylcysteine O-methyltransferase Ste14